MRTRQKPPSRSELRKSFDEEARRLIVVPVELSQDAPGTPGRNSITLRAMVDTGAMATLVRLSSVRGRIPYRRPPREFAAVRRGIDSLVGPLRIFGAFHALIRAEGGPEFPTTIGIIDFSGIPHLKIIDADMILGLDYLNLSAATVDVSARVVRYGREPLPFYQTASLRTGLPGGPDQLPPAQGMRGVFVDDLPLIT